eukprot:gene10691-12383_t
MQRVTARRFCSQLNSRPLHVSFPRAADTMNEGLVLGDEVPSEYVDLVEPHVASFDYFVSEGLTLAVDSIEPIEITHPITKVTHRFWFEDPKLNRPVKEDASGDARLFPRECRESGTTYKGPLEVTFCWAAENGAEGFLKKRLGSLPIMTKSSICHLNGMSRAELVGVKEEANEMGGYFICNGIERVLRCLILQRRHYIMALRRSAYLKRGSNYTDAAVLLRCVRPDHSSATVRLHYLKEGTVNFALVMRRSEFFIPAGILLKCFLEVSDRELYEKIVAGAPPDSGHAAFVAERAELLLTDAAKSGLQTRAQCLEYLGSHFRIVLGLPARKTDFETLIQMLHKLYALVTSSCCEDNADALTHHELLMPGHLLLKFMKEKLEDCLSIFKDQVMKELEKKPEADESQIKKMADRMPDVGRKFEYLLNTGNLVSKSGLDLSQTTGFTVVAEKLNFFRYLSHFRSVHRGAFFAQMRTTAVRKLLPESWGFMCPVHTPDGSPCGLLNHFTCACKVVTHGNDEPGECQNAITQVLANLGMVPSAPALTPPPAPLYLTVTLDGRVVGWITSKKAWAMVERLHDIKAAVLQLEATYRSEGFVIELTHTEQQIPSHLEVVHIPHETGGVYPGIFIFSQSARMIRPVRQSARMIRPIRQVKSGALEFLGTLEQSNMSIRCPDGGAGGSSGLNFTHEELHAGAMLSVVASMTPYSDYNQSPRNMYQCQMAKQTMGTPLQALQHRTDTKLYRIQNPQTPIARTRKYNEYHMDECPNGTNAIVAVLAHTGFDMEDAMILNKSAVERGFMHACLYKTEMVDLAEDKNSKEILAAEPHDDGSRIRPFVRPVGAFGQTLPQNVMSKSDSDAVTNLGVVPTYDNKDSDRIGPDGLPHVGAIVWPGQVNYITKDTVNGRFKAHKLKGEEVGYVDQITVVGKKGNTLLQQANVKMRFNRNPQTGDKFASRHGQKGVLSVQWPDTDMPYCAATDYRNPQTGDKFASHLGQKGVLSVQWPDTGMPYCATAGMRPDLLINPHAFPSRMTIGMLIESMGAKAGALNGTFVDATPFQKSDGKPGKPIEVFGDMLEKSGYARLGQETMINGLAGEEMPCDIFLSPISGLTGEEMPCDIFLGPVYYQRLRHMVSDKFQVRSTGPINNLTRQPIKGRKLGGGIRFGEMERDSLLAHGAAYLLHDRLHTCSDYHVLDACSKCGSIIAPLNKPHAASEVMQDMMMVGADGNRAGAVGQVVCPSCDGSSTHIERVALPYVFKYLATELAAMNIKLLVEVGGNETYLLG